MVTLLKERGIDLVSLEKIDTASAAGELVFHVFGAITHFERRLIADRRTASPPLVLMVSTRAVSLSIWKRSQRF